MLGVTKHIICMASTWDRSFWESEYVEICQKTTIALDSWSSCLNSEWNNSFFLLNRQEPLELDMVRSFSSAHLWDYQKPPVLLLLRFSSDQSRHLVTFEYIARMTNLFKNSQQPEICFFFLMTSLVDTILFYGVASWFRNHNILSHYHIF